MEDQKLNPVTWFEIYVEDMDRATKFYEAVLNVKMQELPNPADQPMQMKAFPATMGANGAGGSLVRMEGMKSGGSNVIVYFSCEDCAIEKGRVEAAGGKICQPKMSIGEFGFCALIADTEGNTIGLHSLK